MERAERELSNKRVPAGYQKPRSKPIKPASTGSTTDAHKQSDGVQSTSMKVTPSVVNLTKPELYGIYQEEGEFIDSDEDEDESENIYNNLPAGLYRSISHHIEESKNTHEKEQTSAQKYGTFVFKIILCCVMLSIAGNLMFYFAEELYESNPVLPNITNYRILYFFQDLLKKKGGYSDTEVRLIGNALQSITIGFASFLLAELLTLILPQWILDVEARNHEAAKSKNIDQSKKQQACSTIGQKVQNFLTLIFDSNLVRSMVSAVGLAYCFKKYQWTSKWQVVLIWSTMNVLIWLGLDSTIIGFVSSACLAVGVMVLDGSLKSDVSQDLLNGDTLSDLLWIGSFVFIGQIILGKIIRLIYD